MTDLYNRALKWYGIRTQQWQLIEEMGEVLQVLSHLYRNRCDKNRVIEELIDLQIVFNSVRTYFINDERWSEKMLEGEQKFEETIERQQHIEESMRDRRTEA